MKKYLQYTLSIALLFMLTGVCVKASEKINISVKTAVSDEFFVQVGSDDTVLALKNAIGQSVGQSDFIRNTYGSFFEKNKDAQNGISISPKFQKLVFADKELENNGEKLKNYGLKNNDCVYLILSRPVPNLSLDIGGLDQSADDEDGSLKRDTESSSSSENTSPEQIVKEENMPVKSDEDGSKGFLERHKMKITGCVLIVAIAVVGIVAYTNISSGKEGKSAR